MERDRADRRHQPAVVAAAKRGLRPTDARRGRIALTLIEPDAAGHFATNTILRAIQPGTALVVVSQVMFSTGQRLAELPGIVAAAHAAGARILIDTYPSLGVFPVYLSALDAGFACGGDEVVLVGVRDEGVLVARGLRQFVAVDPEFRVAVGEAAGGV